MNTQYWLPDLLCRHGKKIRMVVCESCEEIKRETVMTDKDKIELPPLPGEYYAFSKGEVHEYGRACYEAGLAASRAEQAQPAKPKVHSRTYSLTRSGIAIAPYDNDGRVTTVTICWTDDGSAWIESERNRELARRLRKNAGIPITDAERLMISAADALDGGGR